MTRAAVRPGPRSTCRGWPWRRGGRGTPWSPTAATSPSGSGGRPTPGSTRSTPGPEAIERHLADLRAGGRQPGVDGPLHHRPPRASTASWWARGRWPATPPPTSGRPALPARLPKALEEDQVIGLLDSVSGTGPADLRDRALLELLYGTGARISEVVGPVADRPAGRRRPAPGVRQGGQGAAGPPRRPGPGRPRPLARRPAGRPRLAPDRWRPAVATPRRCSSTPGRPPQPPGGLGRRPAPGRAGRARRRGQPPRAPALVRQPHAGPRRRHPGRPGAARATSPSPPPRSTPSSARTTCGPPTNGPTRGPVGPSQVGSSAMPSDAPDRIDYRAPARDGAAPAPVRAGRARASATGGAGSTTTPTSPTPAR